MAAAERKLLATAANGADTCVYRESGSSSQSDGLAAFCPLISSLNFPALAAAAVRARNQHGHGEAHNHELPKSRSLTCAISESPKYGSYNLVYSLTFSDGVKWIARIPGNGSTAFTPLESQRMQSTLAAISLVRKECPDVPIPQIFASATTADNDVGAPYTLESFIAGTSLAELWGQMPEEQRLKLLRQLAGIMSSLYKPCLSFPRLGALSPSASGVGPEVRFEQQSERFWTSPYPAGPFSTTKSFLFSLTDTRMPTASGPTSWARAQLSVLWLAIESIPPDLCSDGNFVLGHPDFQYQNILVDRQGGGIVAMIDWDGPATRPPALGCLRYPGWITRLWGPPVYGWVAPWERGEDAPARLLRYRKEYVEALPDHMQRLTSRAHLLEAVETAAENVACRPRILKWLLEHALGTKELPFAMEDLYRGILKEGGEEGERWRREIGEAFGGMWRGEWEKG